MSEEKKDKSAIDDSAFESLEKDFQDVLNQLTGSEGMDKFREQFEKLHKALKKSHDGEKRLMQKCRELNAEIVANSAKVATALKLSQDDQHTITELKKELDRVWKMADQANEKETRARETIQDLRLEVINLSKLVEQGANLTMGQEHSVNGLLKIKEDLTKEREDHLKEIAKLQEAAGNSSEIQSKLESEKNKAEEKIQELLQDIQIKNNDSQRESRKKEKMERELKQTKAELDAKNSEIKSMRSTMERYNQDMSKLEQQLKEQRLLAERAIKDADMQTTRLQKLQQEYDNQLINYDQLSSDQQSRLTELKQKDDEINQLKKETTRLNKVRETIQRRLRQIEDLKAEVEQQKETLKSQNLALERDLDATLKKVEGGRKENQDAVKKFETEKKSSEKMKNEFQKRFEEMAADINKFKKAEQEIENYKDEAQKQRKIIYQLEKERDRYINEASDLTQKVLEHMELVKTKEMKIFEYKKKIAEAETRLRQQQNLYEAVRSDRNLYSKNLIESQDEITEMKKKLKNMNHLIDQLKEDIQNKENAIVQAAINAKKLEKDKDILKAERDKSRQQVLESKDVINNQAAEEKKLLKIISEADAERVRQKKELEQVISERDILGTQLVRRNDELALLYEKIKIQQSTLNKGEIQYNQRLEDIRVLKLEIRKLRRANNILNKSVANVGDLRREVYHIQRELLRERTRCKALEEELENPMNIHRWRKLEGSDPSQYEMIQKIHTLQKRLIAKTEEVVEKELLIQEKEKLYLELKHILARQPGPEVAEQLQIYQQTLKEKTKQMKATASELNMYESQVGEYKYEIERIARELQEVKKKYFMQKKKEQQTKERDRTLAQAGAPVIQPQRTDGPRFTGGGFNLKSSKAAT